MITESIFELLAAPWVRARAFAAAHRFAFVVAGEAAGTLLLLWGVAYRPRTCIAVALAAYLLHRYGASLSGPAGASPRG